MQSLVRFLAGIDVTSEGLIPDRRSLTREKDEAGPHDVFPQQFVRILLEIRGDVLVPNDVDRDVALDRMGEEDSYGQQYLNSVGQSKRFPQAEGDATLDGAAVTNVAEEAHPRVKGDYHAHPYVQHAKSLHEHLWLLHFVLQWHDLWIRNRKTIVNRFDETRWKFSLTFLSIKLVEIYK